MGNVDRCGTRLRASAIFLSPASLLIEFIRSLLRSGSAKTDKRESGTLVTLYCECTYS